MNSDEKQEIAKSIWPSRHLREAATHGREFVTIHAEFCELRERLYIAAEKLEAGAADRLRRMNGWHARLYVCRLTDRVIQNQGLIDGMRAMVEAVEEKAKSLL